MADLLLHKGRMLASEDHSGLTALHLAARKGRKDMVQRLLGNSNVDVRILSRSELTW